MSKLFLLLAASVLVITASAQKQANSTKPAQPPSTVNLLLIGDKVEDVDGSIIILPKYRQQNVQNTTTNKVKQTPTTTLAKGTYDAKKGAVVFLPKSNIKANPGATVIMANSSNATNNLLTPDDDNTSSGNSNLQPLTDYGTQSLLSDTKATTLKSNSVNNQSLLEPLVPVTKPVSQAKPNYTIKGNETVDPKLMRGQNAVTNSSNMPDLLPTGINPNYNNNAANTTMPDLVPIGVVPNSSNKNNATNNGMPDLVPIGLAPNSKTNNANSGMPDLAPIEGGFNERKSKQHQADMPDLAPIEGGAVRAKQPQTDMPELSPLENNSPNNADNANNTNNNIIKSITLPKGTLLNSKNATYIVKPGIAKPISDDDKLAKPSAGGGVGLLYEVAEDLIEQQQQQIPAKQLYNPPPPTQQQMGYKQTQPVAAQPTATPCVHVHAANCPCCVNKKPVAKKKWKKPTWKKPVYQPLPQSEIITYYQQQDPQKTEVKERIIYVPVEGYKPAAKPVTQQPAPAPQPVVQTVQPKERIIYRDYTNTYTKPQQQGSNCVCPPNNATATKPATTADDKKYYNPNNYAPGLNAGPTSGDYPVTSKPSNTAMRYTFYPNNRGKYSVGLFNDYVKIFLSQDGKIINYEINADPNADPNSYKPKMNYFGSPESIAGIPIEYNHNRSVHKIGNIIFQYDFEGFFKTVGSSQVMYTSRSSLLKVDGVNVRYDANGNVTSVDPNNGLIYYNASEQSTAQ